MVFRRGLALAHARPWNDQSPHTAALRLVRGGDAFVAGCARWLGDAGTTLVRSPAMMENQTRLWRQAGFVDHLELDVYEALLGGRDPGGEPVEEGMIDLVRLASIDDSAFDETWRVGRLGLSDAIAATPASVVMTVPNGADPVGFAIAGTAGTTAYLQRIAVRPEHQSRGWGRRLVRAAKRWAWRRGARTMLLNTQPANEASASLYVSEGFHRLETKLAVLSWSSEP